MGPKTIKIGNKRVGEGYPVLIIAEAGVNHNGDIEKAKKMIKIAAESGADAIKFHTYKTEEIMIKDTPQVEYALKATGESSFYNMAKKLELKETDFEELINLAKSYGILFLSTPFDEGSADFLEKLGVLFFKTPSGELINYPFLKHIAKKNLPMIVSTGMSTIEEVKGAVEAIKREGNDQIVLLHCVSNYPANFESINLKSIVKLKEEFNFLTGYSDHTLGIIAPSIAVALGACVIEKHFTLDKNLLGPDHQASLEPEELRKMVKLIRKTEKALGEKIKKPLETELDVQKVIRKSIIAAKEIKKDSLIEKEALTFKRPGTGILPKDVEIVIGKKAKRDIKIDEIIKWEYIE
ncbi:MAG: N-acetylneuraminate synthase [Nanoarchaeota archaeon]|nr:N-acetylneuraminate synthase [Nanoarchaeota archaeon]